MVTKSGTGRAAAATWGCVTPRAFHGKDPQETWGSLHMKVPQVPGASGGPFTERVMTIQDPLGAVAGSCEQHTRAQMPWFVICSVLRGPRAGTS